MDGRPRVDRMTSEAARPIVIPCCGRIMCKISYLNPTVVLFQPQNTSIKVEERNAPEGIMSIKTTNAQKTPKQKKWLKPKKIAPQKSQCHRISKSNMPTSNNNWRRVLQQEDNNVNNTEVKIKETKGEAIVLNTPEHGANGRLKGQNKKNR